MFSFFRNYIIQIAEMCIRDRINIIVKEKKLMQLTEIHALSVILIKIIEGVDSGEDKFSKLLRGDV